MPTSDSIDAATLARHANFRVQHTEHGIVLGFPVLRAKGAALGLIAFSLLCGMMPALGLSALLPLKSGSAAAMVSLALIGGFAAPFILASIVFALVAMYLLANSLHIEISAEGVRSERRVFGYVTRRCSITRAEIEDIEPRIGARFQNIFSSVPRYALIARHHFERGKDVVIAEDLAGQPLMSALRTLTCASLNIK